ncbi:MAG TPA: tRNA lysidine(34) synthetase TilS [Phenylobacterium sp.]|nr:tRNA lysidine(34) synthetase TilS [Phenylobacterium sp.]
MRGLNRRVPETSPDLAARVADILDLRLRRDTDAPVAVALSGGGDSVALALIASDWARRRGRRLLLLTVDHQLNPASGDWTLACARLAARLGADFRALDWVGVKPGAGLPAAARGARHRLLAEAARAAGARVILMGHTADDRAEAAAMRAAGSTTPDPREWTASPVWPQGRGLFLLRPMLQVGRGELRAWLAARDEAWIDDPSNDNPRFARARARSALAGAGPASGPADMPAGLAGLAARVSDETGLALPRRALREAAPATARALVGAACLCAAGTSRPPRGERLDRLAAALRGDGPVVATLAGARVEADDHTVRWLREAGEIGRGGGGGLALAPGETAVWDGRYEVTTDRAVTLRPLAGRASRLSARARAALSAWPAAARGGLPAVVGDQVLCPAVEAAPGLSIRALSMERLQAACGAIEREPG